MARPGGGVLAAYSLPLAADHVADDPAHAASVATTLGFPVVLKIRSPDITHKSDVGGVAVNLGDADRVRQEATAMLARVKATPRQQGVDEILIPSERSFRSRERLLREGLEIDRAVYEALGRLGA